jgi:hypothetical protein
MSMNLDMRVRGAQGRKRNRKSVCSWANTHALGSNGEWAPDPSFDPPLVSSLNE